MPLTGGTLTGNLLFSTDNTLDIGASGATRPRTGYFGTSIVAPTINATTALQINGTTVLSGTTLGSTIVSSSLTSVGTLTGLTVTAAPTFSAMTSGSVLFASTAGLLSQDNANFFWDATNHRLGIGITNPSKTLTVAGPTLISTTQSTDQAYGLSVSTTHTTATAGTVYGYATTTIMTNSTGTQNAVQGNFAQALYSGTQSLQSNVAVSALEANFSRTGILGVSPVGTVTNGYGFFIDSVANLATGTPAVTFSNQYGTYIKNQGAGNGVNGLTISNATGLYIEAQSGATTNNYAAIFAGGNVGIGTASPSTLLHVYGNADAEKGLTVTNANTAGTAGSSILNFVAGSTVAQIVATNESYNTNPTGYGTIASSLNIINRANGPILFKTNGFADSAVKMTILGNGNVGIGTTSPGQTLELNRATGNNLLGFDVNGTLKAIIGVSSLSDNPNVGMVSGDLGFRTQGGNISFSTDSGNTGNQLYLKNGGNVGIGTTAPGIAFNNLWCQQRTYAYKPEWSLSKYPFPR